MSERHRRLVTERCLKGYYGFMKKKSVKNLGFQLLGTGRDGAQTHLNQAAASGTPESRVPAVSCRGMDTPGGY